MVVATDEFTGLAREAARTQGIPDARIATVAHPIGGISDEALIGRAENAVDSVLALLTRTQEQD